MSKKRKTWREKLEKEEGLPKIVDVPQKWQKRYGTGKMVIAKPLDVDALMREIKKGKARYHNSDQRTIGKGLSC